MRVRRQASKQKLRSPGKELDCALAPAVREWSTKGEDVHPVRGGRPGVVQLVVGHLESPVPTVVEIAMVWEDDPFAEDGPCELLPCPPCQ
eukprot:9852930-Prorocentrum_lima.AAC.1